MKKYRTIGVLGGMGPEATVYFLERLVKNTEAKSDQEHVPVLVYSLPQIPNRTEAILYGGESPLPLLISGAARMAGAGADFIVIPCITAHYFHGQIQAASPVPVMNIVEETGKSLKRGMPGLRKLGLVATSGTVRSAIFEKAKAFAQFEIVVPSAREMTRVMRALSGRRGIKAGYTSGRPRETILAVARSLVERGAQAVIAGCTEIPLVLKKGDLKVPVIEPMDIAARSAIRLAGGRTRPRPERP